MSRILAAVLAIVLLAPPAWAERIGSRHPHHHRAAFVGSAFYFGAPWYPSPWYPSPWYPYNYPLYYYYPPVYAASSEPPPVYVEKFEGKPDADSGEIYCPSLGEHYPEVQECPNGWQRIIRPAS
ncbi:MAG TPA: hypothetical protein VEU32_13795 [Burkholderiales bacterium]|nr:hypothetical protein [Burkholderiales bacterium]